MINNSIFRIKQILDDDKSEAEDKIRSIRFNMPMYGDKFISHKDILLEQATHAVHKKFRLLATMNESINIFNWCDNEYNFIGMCKDSRYSNEKQKRQKVEYTLKQLPKIIDNAESYLKSIKEGYGFSGSPYLISSLQLMGV